MFGKQNSFFEINGNKFSNKMKTEVVVNFQSNLSNIVKVLPLVVMMGHIYESSTPPHNILYFK